MTRLASGLLAALLVLSPSTHALKVYKWRTDGGVEYSDRPPPDAERRTSRRPWTVRILTLRRWAAERGQPPRRGGRQSGIRNSAAGAGPTSGTIAGAGTRATDADATRTALSGSVDSTARSASSSLEGGLDDSPAEPVGEVASPEPLIESAHSGSTTPIDPVTATAPADSTTRSITSIASVLPVFPGAEGFGTQTRAGRGGKVIAVTSLADSGPGTLREALELPGPRTIVFRVAGVIELADFLFVRHPFVTVAGQTAPGDGIVLKNFGLVIPTHDVLIQHIRVRPGHEGNLDPTGNDAIAIFGQHGSVTGAYNVVVDHVSASWSEDEVISTWFAPRDITISWSIISEALKMSRHPKSAHSAGLLIGDGSDRISVRHCLLAHNDFRNPLIIGGGQHDFSNNVVYDWGEISTEIIDDAPLTQVTLLGNRYVPGPSTRREYEMLLNPTGSSNLVKVFMKDNVAPSFGSSAGGDWMLYYGWGGELAPSGYRATTPGPGAPITSLASSTNFNRVLSEAGATLPVRDGVDRRIVSQVKRGTGSIIDSPDDVGGYPFYTGSTPLADSDNDGVPDFWESQLGFDPQREDANGDLDTDGYTNIEEYLHALTD